MTRTVTACLIVLALCLPAFAKDGKGDAAYKACQADMEKYCKDVKPGEGRQIACMVGNVDRLSPDCATIVREKAKHEEKMREKKTGKTQ
jgi:hypothetical protein